MQIQGRGLTPAVQYKHRMPDFYRVSLHLTALHHCTAMSVTTTRFERRSCMNILYRVGILIVLLLFTVVSTSAASACPAQPANADGTTITSPTPDQVVTSPFTIQGMYFGSFEGV